MLHGTVASMTSSESSAHIRHRTPQPCVPPVTAVLPGRAGLMAVRRDGIEFVATHSSAQRVERLADIPIGGSALATLYISTARRTAAGGDDHPDAGRLFAANAGYHGTACTYAEI